MKKFITVVPYQVIGQLRSYVYQAVGNSRLQMEDKVSFPILTAVNGYLQPGEPAKVLALTPETEDGQRNLEQLEEQLDGLCARQGLEKPQVVRIPLTEGDQVSAHVDAFQALIDQVEDDDELFACETYGTKPLSPAVMMAVQDAYRGKRNTSFTCIVYGGGDRSQGRDPECWVGYVYDETALVQLDEIVRTLADRKVSDPRAVIRRILDL